MRYAAVGVVLVAVLGAHWRVGRTMRRHRLVVALYWAPALALLVAGWLRVPTDLWFAAFMYACGAVLAAVWVAEIVQPTIPYEEDAMPEPGAAVPARRRYERGDVVTLDVPDGPAGRFRTAEGLVMGPEAPDGVVYVTTGGCSYPVDVVRLTLVQEAPSV